MIIAARKPLKVGLVVDADAGTHARLVDLLEGEGWRVLSCISAADAAWEAEWFKPSVAFIDTRLGPEDCAGLVSVLRDVSPATRIVMTGPPSERAGYPNLLVNPPSRSDLKRVVSD